MKKLEEIITENDKYYYLCCAGLGDTMLTCGFLHSLKKKLNNEVILILSEKHKFIAKMYELANYIIADFKDTDLKALSDQCRKPEAGKIFVAHPAFHSELNAFFKPVFYQNSTTKFIPWFKNFLGIDIDEKMELPHKYPEITDELLKKCNKIGPLEKMVIFSPEATSMNALPAEFWNTKVNEAIQAGLIPVSNVIDEEHTLLNTHYIELSAEDCVALALKCHSVHSLRSGFCDLIFSLGKKLFVYYPSFNSLYLYSLKDMFKNQDINECIYINEQRDLASREKESKEKFYLFGLFPFFEIQTKHHKKYYKLFGVIIMKKVRK